MNDQSEFYKWITQLELMLRYITTKIDTGESLTEGEEEILRSLFDLYEDGLEVKLVDPNPEGNGH